MQNEFLPLVCECVPLGLVFYDKNGCLKYANGIAQNMFGVTMDEVYDVNIFNDPNITDSDKERLKQGLNASFETDYDFDLCGEPFFNTGIRGTRKYFVTKVTVMRDAGGNRQGFVLTCEDITGKKAQEREIADSYKKIESTQWELSLALDAGKLTLWSYRVGGEGVL